VLNREHQLLDAGAIVFLPEIVGLKAPVFRLGVLVLRHSHRFRGSLLVRAVDRHLAVKTISHPPHFEVELQLRDLEVEVAVSVDRVSDSLRLIVVGVIRSGETSIREY